MPIADWEDDDAYADLVGADPGRLAWELLRRQPCFREAVRKGEDLASFGLVFPMDPEAGALAADPVWRWDLAPALAVRLLPSPVSDVQARRLQENAVFERRSENGRFLRFPNGLQAVLPADIRPSEGVAALLPFGRELLVRISAARALDAGLFGRWREVGGLSGARRLRVVRSLRAFDGRRADASYRRIAEVLLRLRPMGSLEWRTSSERATAIRLCAAGSALVHGGYFRLLGSRLG